MKWMLNSKIFNMRNILRVLGFLNRKYNTKEKKDRALDKLSTLCLTTAPINLYKCVTNEVKDKTTVLIGDDRATKIVQDHFLSEEKSRKSILGRFWNRSMQATVVRITRNEQYAELAKENRKIDLVICAEEDTDPAKYCLPDDEKVIENIEERKIVMFNKEGQILKNVIAETVLETLKKNDNSKQVFGESAILNIVPSLLKINSSGIAKADLVAVLYGLALYAFFRG